MSDDKMRSEFEAAVGKLNICIDLSKNEYTGEYDSETQTAKQLYSLWQAALEHKPVQVSLPHDFITHKDAWRNALVLCAKNANAPTVDSNELAYWMHEVKAFDSAYAALLETEN